MKQWIALAVVAPTLLLGAEKETCPFGPFDLRSPHEQQAGLYHQLSVTCRGGRSERPAPRGRAGVRRQRRLSRLRQLHRHRNLRQDEDGRHRAVGDLLGRRVLPPRESRPHRSDPRSRPPCRRSSTTKPPDKRTKTIDALLASDAFVDRWTMWFGDLVQNVQVSSSSRELPAGRNAYYTYIHDSIKNKKAYDQMVREIIGASGDSFTNGGANFWVRQIQANGPAQDTYDNLAARVGRDVPRHADAVPLLPQRPRTSRIGQLVSEVACPLRFLGQRGVLFARHLQTHDARRQPIEFHDQRQSQWRVQPEHELRQQDLARSDRQPDQRQSRLPVRRASSLAPASRGATPMAAFSPRSRSLRSPP